MRCTDTTLFPTSGNLFKISNILDKIAEALLAISEDRFVESRFSSPQNIKTLNNPQKDDFKLGEEIEFNPLGKGKIAFIDRQPTLTKGKYNLLLEALLDSGQSILVSKIFDYEENVYSDKANEPNEADNLLQLAESKLKPKTLEKLKEYLAKQKKLPKGQLDILLAILKNQE